VAVVVSELGVPKVTVPGPLVFVHITETAFGGIGCPSSVTGGGGGGDRVTSAKAPARATSLTAAPK
jgi:hypothetical protein